jgi:Flp pilus assembly secretin CpaC
MARIEATALAVLLLTMNPAAAAQDQDDRCANQELGIMRAETAIGTVEICNGFASILTADAEIDTIVLGADSIVSVTALSPRVVAIIGRSVGKTNLHFFDSDQTLIGAANVSVTPGTSARPAEITPGARAAEVNVPTIASGRLKAYQTPEKLNPAVPQRVLVHAGAAEILYDCAESCTKLDR